MKKLLTVKGDKLYLNDEEFFLRSGTIQYFRIHPSQWRDRLAKLKRCGLNTVETYIAWNIQEPERGNFKFRGTANFERFISVAENLGLYVIVRPGPFICAEWEMGGFPSWLLKDRDVELRRFNKKYLEYVQKYFDSVLPRIVPHLSTNGGGVIAVQIENEFGGFNRPDKKYMEWVKNALISAGIDVLLFTSDGTWGDCLENGSLDGVLMTANFGSRAVEAKKRVEELRPQSPFVCMEFWNGWFDQWRAPHHARKTDGVIDELKKITENGGHFNIYMFSGGTNFGFYNGSNCNPNFEPTVTSYDYGAPINEAGDATEQYAKIQELLTGGVNLPAERKKIAYGKVRLTAQSLFENIKSFGKRYVSENPITMEDIDQSYGYILYTLYTEGCSGAVDIGEARDRAMFYGDGKYLGTYERGLGHEEIKICDVKELKILVENMGRVNYGQRIEDRKGIIQTVRIGGAEVHGYCMDSIPMKNVPKLSGTVYEDNFPREPMIYSGEFYVYEKADTFLKPFGFTKGVAFVNGFNLGRYWNVGPQKTLYVPSGVLKNGKNELVIFDLYPTDTAEAEFCSKPILDATGTKWE